MKIHMDYLDSKLENLNAQVSTFEKEKSKLSRQVETAQDKLQLIKDNKNREIRDLNRKLTDALNKLETQTEKVKELENKLSMERDSFNLKIRSINNSVEYKNIHENSGVQSSKSKQKNTKYLAHINSGSKTSTAENFSYNFKSAPQQSIQRENAYQTLNPLGVKAKTNSDKSTQN